MLMGRPMWRHQWKRSPRHERLFEDTNHHSGGGGMSLFISSVFTYDEDAGNYIQAVEGASGDNQALEPATRKAINNFVIGCKQDGIWNAIKASCILSGARTLAGALQPLVGTAPTNVGGNFVSGDYVRKTGLVGNGTTKYLDSNRNSNTDPQNSFHMFVRVTTADSSGGFYGFMGQGTNTTGASHIAQSSVRNRAAASTSIPSSSNVGTIATNRASSSGFDYRHGGVIGSALVTSEAPSADKHYVFGRNVSAALNSPTNARLTFYSIGESLDLARLDARVTDLINAFAVTIP